jgi:hypothetical protein
MGLRRLSVLLATSVLLAAPVGGARASDPAVSTLNGKLSTEAGVTGGDGGSSGLGIVSGSLTTPLGHTFGLQIDGNAATAFNAFAGGGTAHLFWRDPAIGLFGPVATVEGGNGVRFGWYGAEAELYAGVFTFGAWGGYHNAVDDGLGLAASSGYYGGSLTFYPIPDLALSAGAGSEFGRASGRGTLEFQPDLTARRNVAFFVTGEVTQPSGYTVTAGVRLYFGPDKSLIRRHREDDPSFAVLPPEINSALMYSGAGSGPLHNAAAAWNGLASDLNTLATGYDQVLRSLEF